MVLVDPSFDGENTKKRDALFTALLKGVGETKITAVNDLGKKQISYPIKKKTEAYYFLVELDGSGVKQGDIQNNAKMQPEVLRYLLTVKE